MNDSGFVTTIGMIPPIFSLSLLSSASFDLHICAILKGKFHGLSILSWFNELLAASVAFFAGLGLG
jgi:hypothetical protein